MKLRCTWKLMVNLFLADFPFLYSLKPKVFWCFKGYKTGTLARNEITIDISGWIFIKQISSWTFLEPFQKFFWDFFGSYLPIWKYWTKYLEFNKYIQQNGKWPKTFCPNCDICFYQSFISGKEYWARAMSQLNILIFLVFSNFSRFRVLTCWAIHRATLIQILLH